MSPQLHIGVVAERTGLSIRTLRHYDDVGLVTPSARSEGGFRLYSERDIDRLLIIGRMKPLEFTLEEMTQLLAAFDVLDDEDAAGAERDAAAAFVQRYQRRAEQACERLRRHLGYALEFSSLMAQRIASARPNT